MKKYTIKKLGWFQLCKNQSNCSCGWGCACFALTLPWSLFDLALTLPWPSLPIALTLPWPCLDLTLTLVSPCLDVAFNLPLLFLTLLLHWLDLASRYWRYAHIFIQMPGQMSPWRLVSVGDDPRNLPLKFSQNRVSNSWSIPYIDKGCLDKCQRDSWNLFKRVPWTFVKVWSASGQQQLRYCRHWVFGGWWWWCAQSFLCKTQT